MKKFLAEFREFAERGSAIDMAVGVIAGAAMNSVVNSLVKDIIMPPIGLLLGNMDMSEITIALSGNTKIGIGLFLNSVVGFILTMFAVFLFVKSFNKVRTKKASDKRDCPFCLSSIPLKATKCSFCCSAVKPVINKSLPKDDGLEKLIDGINPIKNIKSVKKIYKKIVK